MTPTPKPAWEEFREGTTIALKCAIAPYSTDFAKTWPEFTIAEALDSIERYANLLIQETLASERDELRKNGDGDTSDGYHTFNELYEHRHTLFALVCKTFGGWKSRLHDDGTMFEGWFIAGVDTPQGQATYHLPLPWWDRYEVRELPKAPKWDGHSPSDVLTRLASLDSQDKPTN